jgi:glycosyltransferase involved in cell wall biosynthesis
MRIVWDVSPLSHTRTGIPNYVRGSLAGLVEAAGGRHEIVAFAPTSPRGLKAIPEALRGLPVDLRLRFLPFAHAWRQAWSRLGRPALERFVGRFDVLHFSDWMFPPQAAGVRSTMVHDLVPLRFPEWTTGRTRSMHGAKYRNAALTCDLVFANSAFTARDLEERLGIAPERTHVAPPGVDGRFRAEGARADLGRGYVLTVATLEPRKNLGTLLEAHRLLGDGLALAVAGGEGWGERPELRAPDVLPLGYVSDDRLAELYRGAEVAVYPSRFEGFGIPIVEAMASGVPVVASAHPSMDDACGDAAVRVDPDDAEAIARGIERARAERERFVAKGREHSRAFTWRRCGEIHLAAFEEAAAR